MQLEGRIPCLDRPEQILVPRERQIRVVPTLEQQLNSPYRNRLVDLPEQLVEAEHITVRRPPRPVEREKGARGDADVRVVDVAIDDARTAPARMLARADAVRQPPRERCGSSPVQGRGLAPPQAPARQYLVRNRADRHVSG